MRYDKIVKGIFLNRPNRFIAKVLVDGKEHAVHVKNTGRCKELLVEGCTVFLEKSENKNRKTAFDLVATVKHTEAGEALLINMDSQKVNDAAFEWLKKAKLFSSDANIYREVTFDNSRFDFCVEEKGKKSFLEVKGVTLEENGVAMFPDAPTERGLKHINELCKCVSQGYGAYILFVVQMKGIYLFKPNVKTHKAFADALRKAESCGVKVLVYDCIVGEDFMEIDKKVKYEI